MIIKLNICTGCKTIFISGLCPAMNEGIVSTREANRFLEVVQDLPSLKAEELHLLNVALPAGQLAVGKPGIF